MELKTELCDLIPSDLSHEDYLAIKNILTAQTLNKLLTAFNTSGIGGLNSTQRKAFTTTLVAAPVPNEDKEKLVNEILNGNKITAKTFQQPSHGRILDLFPTNIRNNAAFQHIYQPIMSYNQQRVMGKGELMFLLLGQNTSKPKATGNGKKGDVIVDGLHIEMKAGGTIHAGKGDGFNAGGAAVACQKIMDIAAARGFDLTDADLIYSRLAPEGKPMTRGGDWLFKFLLTLDEDERTDIIADLFAEVYHLSHNEARSMAAEVAPLIGDKDAIIEVVAPFVYNAYQKEEGFDALLCLDLDKGYYTINTTAQGLSKFTSFGLPNFGRGKSTQAVPDGGLGIGIKKEIKNVI